MRENLRPRRQNITSTIDFAGEHYHVTQGFYETGKPGEIFINRLRDKTAAKLGDHLDATCRDSAILMSLLLQYGADLAELKHSVTRDEEGLPMSIIGRIIDDMAGGK
jgi:hypothetical protein